MLAAFKQYKLTQTSLAKLTGNSAGSVSNFMKQGGQYGGANNDSYHDLADFVEKLRIATGKPKSRKRKLLETETRADSQPFLGVNPDKKMWIAPI